MNFLAKSIETLSRGTSIDDVDDAYIKIKSVIRKLESESFLGANFQDEFTVMLNRITNYNIVRVANMAYEDYLGGVMDGNAIVLELERCAIAIKEHEDMEIELSLISGLLANVQYKS